MGYCVDLGRSTSNDMGVDMGSNNLGALEPAPC